MTSEKTKLFVVEDSAVDHWVLFNWRIEYIFVAVMYFCHVMNVN